MDGGEWMVSLVLYLMLVLGLFRLRDWHRAGAFSRPISTSWRGKVPWKDVEQRIQAMSTRPALQRVNPPAVRRSRAQLRAERQIIRASLAVGVDADRIAAALRGSGRYNRRRVREIQGLPQTA